MPSQPRTPAGPKTNRRLARISRHSPMPQPAILEIDEMETEYAALADDPAYVHADRYHNLEPGSLCEEDVEHAEAEITELFRCAGRG